MISRLLSVNVIVSVISVCGSASESKLPTHQEQKTIQLPAIAETTEISISADIFLPSDHKLNKGAPSAIDFYEKKKDGWVKIESIQLRDYLVLGNNLSFQKKVHLSEPSTELAVDSTIYHCDLKNTHCAIESFQGRAKRDSKKGIASLNLEIVGSRP